MHYYFFVLSVVSMSVSQYRFHEMYLYTTFNAFIREWFGRAICCIGVAMYSACLLLACKVEEDIQRPKGIINAYFAVKKILNPHISEVCIYEIYFSLNGKSVIRLIMYVCKCSHA